MSDELSNATRIAALEDYNQRLLAENVRLSNEAATERERCGVLEREVRAWHAAEHLRKDEWHAEFGELVEARWNTARTHALDAAKFGKEPA